MAADSTYPTVLQRRQDGSTAVPSGVTVTVESGGSLDVASGGALKIAGTNVTSKVSANIATSSGTAYGTVAAAGSAQGDATAIASDFCVVTAGDGTKGVVLPTAVAGLQVLVKNNANAVLKVYPASGGAINALAGDAAISMAAYTCAIFAASSATQWFTCPLLPS